MTRFLHRPMFRVGGSTGQGITSGLTRQGYKGTDDPADQRVEKPRDTSAADFWLNWGANILAQPGGRPILQTLGTAAREPLTRLQAARTAQSKQDFLEKQYEEKMDFEREKFKEDKRQFGLELEQYWKVAELEAQGENNLLQIRLINIGTL